MKWRSVSRLTSLRLERRQKPHLLVRCFSEGLGKCISEDDHDGSAIEGVCLMNVCLLVEACLIAVALSLSNCAEEYLK